MDPVLIEFAKVFVPPVLAAGLTAWLAVKTEGPKINARFEHLNLLITERRSMIWTDEEVRHEFSLKREASDRKRASYATLIGLTARAYYEIDVISRFWGEIGEHQYARDEVMAHARAFIELSREAMRDIYPARLYVSDRSKAAVDEVIRVAFGPTQANSDPEWLLPLVELFRNAKDVLIQEAERELNSGATKQLRRT